VTNRSSVNVTGLIKRESRLRSITIPWPMIIFDARSWARAWADKMAVEATAAGIAGDYDTSITLARAGAELISWLSDDISPIPSWPELAVRQELRPLVVGRAELPRYMDAVWEHSKSTEVGEGDPFGAVDFLLDIDAASLSATRKNRVILRHSGDIRAREVTRVELENHVAIAMIMCAPELDKSSSDEDEIRDGVGVAPMSAHANREANTTTRLAYALAAAMPHMRVDSNTRIGELVADLAIPDAGLLVEIKQWSDHDGARLAGEAFLAMRPVGWCGMLIDSREIEQNLGDAVERVVGLCAGV
jgi:hypothetical protein